MLDYDLETESHTLGEFEPCRHEFFSCPVVPNEAQIKDRHWRRSKERGKENCRQTWRIDSEDPNTINKKSEGIHPSWSQNGFLGGRVK